jgi:Cft2 family RNA processing exonuclease
VAPRTRSTPYPRQLDKLLNNADDLATFSAASLVDRFEHPPHQKLGTNIGRIHKALRIAFSQDRIVTFVDDDGHVLREPEIVTHGSKAIGQPQIFGRPGTASPDPAYHPATYAETQRRGIAIDEDGRAEPAADDHAAANGVAPVSAAINGGITHEGDDHADGTHQPIGDDGEAVLVISADEAMRCLKAFPPAQATAPEVVPERVLRTWVSLPGVCKHLLHGLDAAQGLDKFELIRAGVNRKQRSWRSESTTAGNLGALCRSSSAIWGHTVSAAIVHYLSDSFAAGELPRLASDPLGFYEDAEHPPDGMLLLAMALGVDGADLELLASACAADLGQLKAVEQTTAQQERIATLEAEAVELRKARKDAEKASRARTRELTSLSEEAQRLRAATAEAGTAAEAGRSEAERKLTERAEQAEAELEKLLSERLPELEAELAGLEDVHSGLEAADTALIDERRLREQAEQDAQRLGSRVRELTDRLTKAEDARSLPTENAAALIDALGRPVGQAARHAAERLAGGRARPHDELLLELASTIARMTRSLDLADAADETAGPNAPAQPLPDAGEASEQVPAQELAAPAAEVPPEFPDDVEVTAAPVEEPVDVPDADAPAPEFEPEPVAEAPALRRGLRRRVKLKVRPLGGAGEVGGSAILVQNNAGHTVLLDCGQRVRGEYGIDTEPQFHLSIHQADRLHAILISHAHIDHVGSLPKLHLEQSAAQHERIPVYMTEPTRALAQIMLDDSAKIQQYRETSEAERAFLDYGQGAMEAVYRPADVHRVMSDEFVEVVAPALAVRIPDTDFVVRFIPVAHVLGSCAIHLTDIQSGQTLLYTGDLGPITDPQITLPHYGLGEMLPAHMVIIESTYGAQPMPFNDGKRARRALRPREAAVRKLCQMAEQAHDSGGSVLLPAFSLGRTQELAMLIHQARQEGLAPAGDIVVAGMGEKISAIYRSYSRGTNPWARADEMPRIDELGRTMRSGYKRADELAMEVLESGFSYVIASPAMLGSGWSRTFLDLMVDNPAHVIAMSGYVPRHGGHIPRLHTLHKGDMIDLGDGRPRRIQADFEHLKGLSAHAPNADLRQFAAQMARQGENTVFAMVHGDRPAQEALAEDVAALPDVVSAQPLHNGDVWQPQRP